VKTRSSTAPTECERLLEAASVGALSLAHFRHAQICESCRVSFERTRRLAKTWQALEPGSAETLDAYAGFLARSKTPRRTPVALRVVPAIIVFATAVASAAVHVTAARHRRLSLDTSAELPLVSAAASDSQRPSIAGPAPADASSAAARIPSAAPPDRKRPLFPRPVPAQPTLTLPHPSETMPPAQPPNPEARATRPPSSAWTVAASAMREGDYARAERAFDELAAEPDPYTRDSARLARAQVWLAEGRAALARPELADLAATGATAVIRQQAADALGGSR
jgi:hypothetical protein